MIEQYTYWSMTINNPDENDYLIVRNPNTKYVRELVWTREVGAEGTEHIQAWLRLQRNQSQSFVKKIYPRAHFKPCKKDDYNENCHQYAQKNDDTTAGSHHITIGDPLPGTDTLLYQVLEQAYESLLERQPLLKDHHDHEGIGNVIERIRLKDLYFDVVEREMIMKRSGLEKIFISPTYEKMKNKYWKEILFRIFTNKDADTERTEGDEKSTSQKSGRSEVCEDNQDCESETDEGTTESECFSSCSSYD